MHKNQFEQEKHFCAALAIAAHLLKCELITAREHRELTAALWQKYRPAVSSLCGHADTSHPPQENIYQKGGKNTNI